MFYNEFPLKLVILVPEINISRTTTLEFRDFSRVFQGLCLFPGISRVCTNPVSGRSSDCDAANNEWCMYVPSTMTSRSTQALYPSRLVPRFCVKMSEQRMSCLSETPSDPFSVKNIVQPASPPSPTSSSSSSSLSFWWDQECQAMKEEYISKHHVWKAVGRPITTTTTQFPITSQNRIYRSISTMFNSSAISSG